MHGLKADDVINIEMVRVPSRVVSYSPTTTTPSTVAPTNATPTTVMSSFFNKIREKATRRHSSGPKSPKGGEQQLSIQPHPAKTNDPADLAGPQPGGGLATASDPASAVHSMPGPVIPNAETHSDIPPPASRDELRARAAELNK